MFDTFLLSILQFNFLESPVPFPRNINFHCKGKEKKEKKGGGERERKSIRGRIKTKSYTLGEERYI